MGIEEVLLGSRGVELPDPVAQAKAGLSLADLSTQNQIRQYALATQQRQDKARQVLGQVLPALQQAGWTDEAIQTAIRHPLVQQNPEVIQDVLKEADAQRKSQLEAGKTRAATDKDRAEAMKNSIGLASNFANGILQSGQVSGRVSPMDAQRLVSQVAHAYQIGGYDPKDLNIPALGSSAEVFMQFARGVAAAGQTPLDAARQKEIIEGNLPKQKAETQKAIEETRLAPLKFEDEQKHRRAIETQGSARINQEAISAPQEVTLPGGQLGFASFNKKGGGWRDPATGAPITGTVGPKAPEMPAAARTQFAANNQLLTKVDDALAQVTERPASFGLKYSGPDAVNQRLDPKGVAGRAAVASVGSQKFHDLSGAAITISEAPRLQPFIPSVNDTSQAIKTKLNGLRRETEILQRELVAGRPTFEAIRAPAVTSISAAPDITSITRVE